MNKDTLLKEVETALRAILKVRTDLDVFGLNHEEISWKAIDHASNQITIIADMWKHLQSELQSL